MYLWWPSYGIVHLVEPARSRAKLKWDSTGVDYELLSYSRAELM